MSEIKDSTALDYEAIKKKFHTPPDKLKACPYPCCKSENVSLSDMGGEHWWVDCNDCDASGSICETKQEAIDAWNTRTLVAIKALKEVREKIVTIPQWIIGGENQSDDYREGYKKAWDDSRQRSSKFINEQIRELEDKR